MRRGDATIADFREGQLDPLSPLWDKGDPSCRSFAISLMIPPPKYTLATAIFHVGATSLRWRVYDKADAEPCFTFDNTLTPSEAGSLHDRA